jgi:hypothetical protein
MASTVIRSLVAIIGELQAWTTDMESTALKKTLPTKTEKYYEKAKLNRSNMSFELAKIMRRNGRSDSLPSSANIALDHAENSVNPHAMW